MDDRRSRNGTDKTPGSQPYLLHAQWHKVSTVLHEKDKESMALIVVYRYDLFYVPWAMNATVSDTADVGKKNGTADSLATTSTSTSQRPLNDESSNSSSWSKPWPYGPVRRITTSGSGSGVSGVGEMSNGVADYLYESETRVE